MNLATLKKSNSQIITKKRKNIEQTETSALQHLLEQHALVVAETEKIADLPRYFSIWKSKFSNCTENPLQYYCTTISAPDSSGSKAYYMLSDIIPEDKKLRSEIQQDKLKLMIDKQQAERFDDSFQHKCLFCKQTFTGNRKLLFTHMFQLHSFNIGLPDNLVDVNELLDILQQKIDKCICIYCEKTFKSYSVLKLHMRKKKHFKLNSKSRQYDRFYIINYLEEGKNWIDFQQEDNDEDEYEDDEFDHIPDDIGMNQKNVDNWDEWQDDNEDKVLCLFCNIEFADASNVFHHCKDQHNFDFETIKQELKLDFYGCVKLINYIRYTSQQQECIYCNCNFDSMLSRLKHMQNENHFKVSKDATFWSENKFLLPTITNDPLLYIIDDND